MSGHLPFEGIDSRLAREPAVQKHTERLRLAQHLADYSRFRDDYAANAGTPANAWAAGTPYPFVAVLSDDEVAEFLRELATTLLSASETRRLDEHEGTLAAWRSTAEIVANPAVLVDALAPIDPDPGGSQLL